MDQRSQCVIGSRLLIAPPWRSSRLLGNPTGYPPPIYSPVDESGRIWLAYLLLLSRVPLDRNWHHLTHSVFRAPSSLLDLDASFDFLPRANYHREARVSRPRLGKSLIAIEALRKGASLLFKFCIATRNCAYCCFYRFSLVSSTL